MMRGVRAGPVPAGATEAAQAVESAASSSRDVTALLVLLRRGLCGDGGPVRAALQHVGVNGPQWALGSAALAQGDHRQRLALTDVSKGPLHDVADVAITGNIAR